MANFNMNKGQLRAEVETYLMNTSADAFSLSWTPTEIDGYLNEATLYTQQVTMWFQEFSNVVCTASVSTYTAPNTAYQLVRATWDREFLPQTNEYELDRDDPSWRAAPVNNPFRFYFPTFGQAPTIAPFPTPSQNGYQYAPFSSELGVVAKFLNADGLTPDTSYTFNQEVGIIIGVADSNAAISYFQPDVVADPFIAGKAAYTYAASGELGELQMYSTDELNIGLACVRIPDTMVSDLDIPQLPAQTHYGLIFYALMKCFMREGEFQDMQLAADWFTAYGDWMESVLENKARWWPTRVRSLEPFEEGSLFAQRMNSIGYPMQLDLKPSYG